MKVICRTRQMGKTTDLLQDAVDEGWIFVCHNIQEKERLERICREANQIPPTIWTYDHMLHAAWHGRRELKGLVIDNVDMLLQQLAGSVEVKAIAINQEIPDAENQ